MHAIDASIPVLPGGLPLVGHLPAIKRDRLAFLERVQSLGPAVVARLGPRCPVFVVDPEILQTVLVERAYDFHKSSNYGFLERLLGKGLVTSEDDLHKRQRRLTAPSFTPARIAAYANTMVEVAKRRIGAWRDGETIDLGAELHRLTLDIACRTLFSTDVGPRVLAIGQAFVEASRWVVDESVSFLHWPYHWPVPRHRRMQRSMATLHAAVEAIIAERHASQQDAGDILSALMGARDESGAGMTDEQLRDEVITFLFAGHETSANALVWALVLLSQNAEARSRLVEEVDQCLGGRQPATSDLPKLAYPLRVFKETLRLYPPAYVFGRTAVRDVPCGKHTVFAGQNVVVNVWALHRRPDIYDEPERFLPDRFLPDCERALPRHAFLPFAAGPRVCVGNHFAMIEGQLVLALLAQQVSVELAADRVGLEPVITLRAASPLAARIRRRA
ncbi:MAG TPA: cytochrome P450 [Polyangiaceae bacterium]|nr:cytochrome P450 [Polyangiaceae bacterium]